MRYLFCSARKFSRSCCQPATTWSVSWPTSIAFRNHVLPAMGEVRLGEATTPLVDNVIASIKNRVGAATAKSCRSVISGVMSLAVRYGAVTFNPVREVERIEAKPTRVPRALTTEERIELIWSACLSRGRVRRPPRLLGRAPRASPGVPLGERVVATRGQSDIRGLVTAGRCVSAGALPLV